MKTRFLGVLLLVALILVVFAPSASAEPECCVEPPYVEEGEAAPVVDGSVEDWDGVEVFFQLRQAWKGCKPVLADVYMLHDCRTSTLYVEVDASAYGRIATVDWNTPPDPNYPSEEIYLKVAENTWPPPPYSKLADGGSGNDGTPPDFSWIDYDLVTETAGGFEMSVEILSPFDGYIQVHTNVWPGMELDGDSCPPEPETAGWTMHVCLDCVPTGVTLSRFEGQCVEHPDGEGYDVLIEWETAMEIDTVGFNLYRSSDGGGTWAQLNDSLIPATGMGGVGGAEYSFLNEDVPSGEELASGVLLYKLEVKLVGGGSEWHGPIEIEDCAGPNVVGIASVGTGPSVSTLAVLAGLALITIPMCFLVTRHRR